MKQLTGSLLGRIALRFEAGADYVPADLSAATRVPGGGLIVAADERAALELLTASAERPHTFGAHTRFPLHAALGLEDGDEVDIEGASCSEDGDALFVVGSHSAKRKKPKGKSDEDDFERLATVKLERTREVLARVPLSKGRPLIAQEAQAVASLAADGEDSLLGLLADDPHLGPFLPRDGAGYVIPGKDNGFDIEGLACFQGRLLIGLRGPVLRGWAFVLDLEVCVGSRGTLEIAGGAQRYRKHALQLDGLGVRELVVHGDDVLVLAGPTMTLDGAQRLFRWVGGPSAKKNSIVLSEPKQLEPLFDIPLVPGHDRAEGIARFSWFDEDDSLLIAYDTPSPARVIDETSVMADVFALGR